MLIQLNISPILIMDSYNRPIVKPSNDATIGLSLILGVKN